MKIVLYNNEGIVQHVEHSIGDITERGSDYITHTNGGFSGLKVNYAVVENEYEVEEGDTFSPDTSTLDGCKADKIEELDRECEASILRGFTSQTTGHFYTCSFKDQINFDQLYTDLRDSPEDYGGGVPWGTADAGAVTHTIEEFLAVCREFKNHKWANVFLYRQLKGQVENATQVSEINAIKWEPIA